MKCWLVILELSITQSRTSPAECQASLYSCSPLLSSPVGGGQGVHVGVAPVVEAHRAHAQASQAAV